MRKLRADGQVILGVDHDAGGDKIGAKIEAIYQSIGRPELEFVQDVPQTPGDNWNDQLPTPGAVAEEPPLVFRPTFANR